MFTRSMLVFEKKSFRTEDAKGAVALHDPVCIIVSGCAIKSWLKMIHCDAMRGAGLLEQGTAAT